LHGYHLACKGGMKPPCFAFAICTYNNDANDKDILCSTLFHLQDSRLYIWFIALGWMCSKQHFTHKFTSVHVIRCPWIAANAALSTNYLEYTEVIVLGWM